MTEGPQADEGIDIHGEQEGVDPLRESEKDMPPTPITLNSPGLKKARYRVSSPASQADVQKFQNILNQAKRPKGDDSDGAF